MTTVISTRSRAGSFIKQYLHGTDEDILTKIALNEDEYTPRQGEVVDVSLDIKDCSQSGCKGL